MTTDSTASEGIKFADEPRHGAAGSAPWKILVADDDEEIHKVTRLALTGFTHYGRGVSLVHARSGAEAVSRMREHPDTALVLMDVVMETEHAGLDAVLTIRHQLKNSLTRIVIRTGQPGQAPEELVVKHYDISDYREKTEITSRRLHTIVHHGLSQFRELAELHDHKHGLEQVIGASTELQAQRNEEDFARRTLQQLVEMLYGEPAPADALMALRLQARGCRVLAGTGRYAPAAGLALDEVVTPELNNQLEAALRDRATEYGATTFLSTLVTSSGVQLVLHVSGERPLSPADPAHIGLFGRAVAAGFENLRLTRALKDSQRSLILLLSTAIEQRVHSGGVGHGQRVARLVRLLGEVHGLPESVLEWLPLAATLHDVGEIAIPESILNKPGDLTRDEQALMETHTRWGQDLLRGQESDMLQIAGLIAGQHHERWDGAGYPNGLRGEQIHLYARLAGLANGFDEMLHPRGGRVPPLATVITQLEKERGKAYDPSLVDLMLKNIDRFVAITHGGN
jgi:response regulator RpfG family c-di-GMP phosphodiesterase